MLITSDPTAAFFALLAVPGENCGELRKPGAALGRVWELILKVILIGETLSSLITDRVCK